MLFNSLQYIFFLPIVLFLYWCLPRKFRALILLIASYVFYSAWNPVYLLLLIGMTIFNYLIGFVLKWAGHTRKWWLIFAILVNVGTLGYYKYAKFVLENIFGVMDFMRLPHDDIVVKIFLPLGISFFTFEFLHYIVDVYKGGEPERNFIHFALLPGFFPSQIAGPIKRYQDFMPQLKEARPFDMDNFEKGFVMVLHGLAKKILLADNLSIYVDFIYKNPSDFTCLELWLATYAFAFQVYCDFSGYTDVAIGSALMMNLCVPPNFNVPYMSNNIRELWHRQHISLSFWFRDYVYIPLGGSRCSVPAIYRNLILTTALAGLWHGAAWHFVAWGAFQGLSLIVHRQWMLFYKSIDWLYEFVKGKIWHAIAIFITFQAFAVSFVFFRADDLPTSFDMVGRMMKLWELWPDQHLKFLTSNGPMIFPMIPYVLAGLVIAHIISEPLRDMQFWPSRPRWMKGAYCAFLIIIMIALMPEEQNKFIYFQF